MARTSIELRGDKVLKSFFKNKANLTGLYGIVYDSAKDIQRQSKENAPVDTGYMKKWIRISNQKDIQRTVRSNAPYSGFVENGTVNQNAQPFMKPAVNMYSDDFKKKVSEEIRRKV